MSVDPHLLHLNRLIRRGRELREALAADSTRGSTLAETRIWQRDCASAISHLSGGSKAHWLARRFSEAFLVRSPAQAAIEQAAVTDIVQRIVAVLGEAASSLSRMDTEEVAVAVSGVVPRVPRFDFVHNPELRPALEQTFQDSGRAYEEGAFGQALILSCGILETLITDSLEHAGVGPVVELSFDARIAAAERAKLIRSGCARLPAVARRYRELADPDGGVRPGVAVSERDARLAGQVLQVVMRDLDPGR